MVLATDEGPTENNRVRPMVTMVLRAPGRDATSETMLDALFDQNPAEQVTVYAASGRTAIGDFWGMLHTARRGSPGCDLLALEDDIVTARNFIAYARRWQADCLTSFFNGRGFPEGLRDAKLFGFNQALKIPARLLEQLTQDVQRVPVGRFQDDALAWELQRLGEPVYYHRSLVQHVGAQSLVKPGQTLEGRTASDFVGEDFDCLTLLDGPPVIGTAWARCGGCKAQRQIAGDVPGRPGLSMLFAALDALELLGAGWTRDRGVWWCRYCTRRRNLMRAARGGGQRSPGGASLEVVGKKPGADVEPPEVSNVTDPSPPSGTKM